MAAAGTAPPPQPQSRQALQGMGCETIRPLYHGDRQPTSWEGHTEALWKVAEFPEGADGRSGEMALEL